jgi:nucleotide-binding universal stress UspA family protein
MSEILVGIDGSVGAQDALAFAKQLAGITGVGLRLANAYPYDDMRTRASNETFRDLLRTDADALLDSIDEGDVARDAVADTSAAHALHELAEEHGASLVVVGSTHRGRVGRVMPGSTGERLLHGAPCPVAIVPKHYGAEDHPLRTIGVGYDGSDESEAALATATELARRVGATLRVIRVFDATEIGTPALMSGPGYINMPKEIERTQRERFERRMSEQPNDVVLESVFCIGSPNRDLAAESESVDLMVMGSRGYGPLHAVLLGGVAHAVVRKAACPVIILPRGVKTRTSALLSPVAEATA